MRGRDETRHATREVPRTGAAVPVTSTRTRWARLRLRARHGGPSETCGHLVCGAHVKDERTHRSLSDAVRTSRTFAKVRLQGLGQRTTVKRLNFANSDSAPRVKHAPR